MTSDKAQIQALINGIDEALNKTNPRLPWVMSNDAAQQRQVLEQTRQYLASLQQLEAERSPSSEDAVPRLPAAVLPSESPSEAAQQVLQAVLQEMNYWRVNMLQPLRTEIDSLQRQREMLTQEIRQLETQRQQHNLGAPPNQQLLMEFLQSAMAQMQANLSGQVTQMIASQIQSEGPALSGRLQDSQSWAALSPAERLEQMQKTQIQSDQLMLKLDSTLQVIFESLNRNVQTYEESLEQGLNRMHSLGQQGEAMFAFLVNRLAQQLGREASTFLQTSAPANWQQSSTALPADSTQGESSLASERSDLNRSDFLSQIPASTQSTFAPAVPFDLSEEVLDISELELAELDSDQPLPDANTLEGLDLELSQLDLSAIPPDPKNAFDLFAGDQSLPTPLEASDSSPDPSPDLPSSTATPPVISDLESALDLLNQLSAEMQANAAMLEEETAQPQTALSSETELITTPDSLYDDTFYSNLHDATANATPEPIVEPALDAMTLQQAWFDGLGDPAAESPSEPTLQSNFSQSDSSSSVSQSLETFLLSSPAPTPAAPDLFTNVEELSNQPAPHTTPPEGSINESADNESAEEPIETIASLTDLLPDITNPVESLPVAEAPIENFSLDLGSNADTLAQLGADLGQPSPDSLELTEGWDLFADLPSADLSGADLPTPAYSEPAPIEPIANPPAVTIEGLEGLFEDLPDLEPPAAPAESTAAESSPRIEATPDLFAQLKAAFSQDSGTSIEAEPAFDLSLNPDPSDSEKKK